MMIVISILTFLLFEAIPNGNPACRLAGRLASRPRSTRSSVKYGFDKPIYIQYVRTMENIFTGQAVSYYAGLQRARRDQAGLPATLSLAIGAGIIWLLPRSSSGPWRRSEPASTPTAY